MQQDKKVALVLATGCARGLAHIGVIEELVRQNYTISSIAGCSMGAVVGAAEDLDIPFTAVATNILNQQEVIFNQGKIIDALRAFISLPFVFKPYEFNNMCLIDGGLLNPLPLDRVARTAGDISSPDFLT